MLHYRHELDGVKAMVFHKLKDICSDLFHGALALVSSGKRLKADLSD